MEMDKTYVVKIREVIDNDEYTLEQKYKIIVAAIYLWLIYELVKPR